MSSCSLLYFPLAPADYILFQTLFHHLNVPFIGKSGHYKFLKSHVNPCVWSSWILEQNKTLETMKVSVTENGRTDGKYAFNVSSLGQTV